MRIIQALIAGIRDAGATFVDAAVPVVVASVVTGHFSISDVEHAVIVGGAAAIGLLGGTFRRYAAKLQPIVASAALERAGLTFLAVSFAAIGGSLAHSSISFTAVEHAILAGAPPALSIIITWIKHTAATGVLPPQTFQTFTHEIDGAGGSGGDRA